MKTEMTQHVAKLNWSLYVECPSCKESNDIASPSHDRDNRISQRIFSNEWDKLKGYELKCEECGHEFELGSVEY